MSAVRIEEEATVTVLHGRCACGALHYRARTASLIRRYCRCGFCRTASRAGVLVAVELAAQSLCWLGDAPLFYPHAGDSHAVVCAVCGNELALLGRDGKAVLDASTIDDASKIGLRSHVQAFRAPDFSLFEARAS